MNSENIFNRAYKARAKWHYKGVMDGKFILGAECVQILRASDYYLTGHVTRSKIMGFPYVIDYDDIECIEFCPKTEEL